MVDFYKEISIEIRDAREILENEDPKLLSQLETWTRERVNAIHDLRSPAEYFQVIKNNVIEINKMPDIPFLLKVEADAFFAYNCMYQKAKELNFSSVEFDNVAQLIATKNQEEFFRRCKETGCNPLKLTTSAIPAFINAFALIRAGCKTALGDASSENLFVLETSFDIAVKATKQNQNLSMKGSNLTVKNSTAGCYVATCVYGSYDCPEVWILRRYRDNYLGERFFGRIFIKLYYTISPIIVKMFGKNKCFKRIFKKFLDKKIIKLKKIGYKDDKYEDKVWK